MDDEWIKETMLLSRLNHKNIVKYEDHLLLISKETYSHPCILTEFCQVILLLFLFRSLEIDFRIDFFIICIEWRFSLNYKG